MIVILIDSDENEEWNAYILYRKNKYLKGDKLSTVYIYSEVKTKNEAEGYSKTHVTKMGVKYDIVSETVQGQGCMKLTVC